MFMLSSALIYSRFNHRFFFQVCGLHDTKNFFYIYIHSSQLHTKEFFSPKNIPTEQRSLSILYQSNLPNSSTRNDTTRQSTRTRSTRHILSLELNRSVRPIPPKRIQQTLLSKIALIPGLADAVGLLNKPLKLDNNCFTTF